MGDAIGGAAAPPHATTRSSPGVASAVHRILIAGPSVQRPTKVKAVGRWRRRRARPFSQRATDASAERGQTAERRPKSAVARTVQSPADSNVEGNGQFDLATRVRPTQQSPGD